MPNDNKKNDNYSKKNPRKFWESTDAHLLKTFYFQKTPKGSECTVIPFLDCSEIRAADFMSLLLANLNEVGSKGVLELFLFKKVSNSKNLAKNKDKTN